MLRLLLFGFFFIEPTNEFPSNTYFTIERGQSLSEISTSLAEKKVVRSSLFFRGVVSLIFLSGDDAIAGDYFFERPISTFEVAKRIIGGIFIGNSVKITFPEGLTKYEIAEIIKKTVPTFNTLDFTTRADEGYIFPDTYFFPPNVSSSDVMRITRKNFENRTKDFTKMIEVSGRSLPDIIKMASILELEANKTEDRKIISGILWKRLSIGMPLQVDVSFRYINGKNSFDLTADDLRIDSAYNSYRYKGLPPTPISNPGLDAIEAAINSDETSFLYYISDKNSNMHYATTFEDHKKNKFKYLK